MKKHIALVLLTLLSASVLIGAQETGAPGVDDVRILRRSYVFEGTGRSIPYAVFVPPSYDLSKVWPLIVGLHGVGRPYDWLMGYEGLLDMAARDGFIVATPLGYNEFGWYGSAGPAYIPGQVPSDIALRDPPPPNLGELSERDVMNVVGLVVREFRVDPGQIFLFGHSMGGGGAYHLAATYPDKWRGVAVAAPAPDATLDQLQQVKRLPFLVLQGDADQTVAPAKTRATVGQMKSLGIDCTYVEVEGGDHTNFIARNRDVLSRVFSFFNSVRQR